MFDNEEGFLLPATCKACKGSGVGHRMDSILGKRTVRECVCIRCNGLGIYDVLGKRDWQTVEVGNTDDLINYRLLNKFLSGGLYKDRLTGEATRLHNLDDFF